MERSNRQRKPDRLRTPGCSTRTESSWGRPIFGAPAGQPLLQCETLRRSRLLHFLGQRKPLQHRADSMVSALQSIRIRRGVQPKIPPRRQRGPALEADFQQIAVYGAIAIDAHHALYESPAPPGLLLGCIQLACRIAGGPDAFRAVFSPGDQGARRNRAVEIPECGGHLRREFGDELGLAVCFCLVHVCGAGQSRSNGIRLAARGSPPI